MHEELIEFGPAIHKQVDLEGTGMPSIRIFTCSRRLACGHVRTACILICNCRRLSQRATGYQPRTTPSLAHGCDLEHWGTRLLRAQRPRAVLAAAKSRADPILAVAAGCQHTATILSSGKLVCQQYDAEKLAYETELLRPACEDES